MSQISRPRRSTVSVLTALIAAAALIAPQLCAGATALAAAPPRDAALEHSDIGVPPAWAMYQAQTQTYCVKHPNGRMHPFDRGAPWIPCHGIVRYLRSISSVNPLTGCLKGLGISLSTEAAGESIRRIVPEAAVLTCVLGAVGA